MYPVLPIIAFLATVSTFSFERGVQFEWLFFPPHGWVNVLHLAIGLHLKISRQEITKAQECEQCFTEQVLNWGPQSELRCLDGTWKETSLVNCGVVTGKERRKGAGWRQHVDEWSTTTEMTGSRGRGGEVLGASSDNKKFYEPFCFHVCPWSGWQAAIVFGEYYFGEMRNVGQSLLRFLLLLAKLGFC